MRYWSILGGLAMAAAAHAGVHVTDVRLTPEAGGWRVCLAASAKTPFTVHTLSDPDRLIIDVPDALLDPEPQLKGSDPSAAPVLRYSQFSEHPDKVRVVLSLPAGTRLAAQSASPSQAIWVAVRTGMPAASPKRRAKHELSPSLVISARDLEAQMDAEGRPPKSAVASRSRASAKRQPVASRSSVSSREGIVDRSEVAAESVRLAEPPQPVAPAWSPDDAVAYIRDGAAPGALRKRLIDVVTDPAVQASRYVWGAETPGQFDCSGLALYVYDALDVKLPRCSWQQCEVGQPVDRDSLRAGDLVFFNTRGSGVSHVGIYLGDGKFLHAANPRSNLQITALDNPYYSKRFVCARRVYEEVAANETERMGG